MRGVLFTVLFIIGSLVVAGCKDKKPKGKTPPPADGGIVKVIPRPPGVTFEPAALDQVRANAIAALLFENQRVIRLCVPAAPVAPATIDVDRSLFVHDRVTIDALGPDTFSLKRTLDELAGDAVAAGAVGTTHETLFRDLWDTQNPRRTAATPAGAQCDDDGTTLNGFPNACRPKDGAQAKVADLGAEIATYRPIALVNRLDLAAQGWKNCGEHRIVYGRVGAGRERSFIIFEAVLPNPRPGCQSGCRAVAERWYKLSSTADPIKRAQALEELFYKGLPGFRPVVHFDHYSAKGPSSGYGSAGSGQIRTNQFLDAPWMLKEFKLALDCTVSPCVADVVPIPVKNNPDGNLWTEATAGLANDFQSLVVVPQAGALGTGGLNDFSYQVPVVYDAARSEAQTGGLADHYGEAYTAVPGVPGGFRSDLVAAAVPTGLDDKQLVNRALALSCAGCHQPATFGLLAANAVGPALPWPDSAGFVHTKAEDSAGIHALSPALVDVFLPARKANLASFLNDPICLCRFKLPGVDVPRFELPLLQLPPRTITDLRNAEDQLKVSLDAELVKLGRPPLPPLAPDLKAQPLILDEVKAAGADVARQSLARTRAVLRIVAEEPPRLTVTGSFRTH